VFLVSPVSPLILPFRSVQKRPQDPAGLPDPYLLSAPAAHSDQRPCFQICQRALELQLHPELLVCA
jgi:hypothetical protein